MDILIPDNWLRDHLKTTLNSKEIAKFLSLCGPSVEKITGTGKNLAYQIEITTNRVDSASVYGIAREASAILPRFGVKAHLVTLKTKSTQKLTKKVVYLKVNIDEKLCSRFTACLVKNVKIDTSPKWLSDRLILSGIRPLNNIVDISNYIMLELGQPVHMFDYQKIQGSEMKLRCAKKGETIQTLDGKIYELKESDIVIEDGGKKLIDLAGIMGGNASKIDEKTQDVLVFVQTYNPINIRKTSMRLGVRTLAATIFEKGPDSAGVEIAVRRALDLVVKIAKGKPESKILDIYASSKKKKSISTSLDFINKKLGVNLTPKEISQCLQSLGFNPVWHKTNLEVDIPSYRANDIEIEEDIVEEVARIFGYHALPSKIMEGEIPTSKQGINFDFEYNLKNTLKGFGGVEIYTLSLVPKSFVGNEALKLKNPLGLDSQYLRTSLKPSLRQAANENLTSGKFHLFEMANVYLPNKNNLPEEKLTLAGIFSDFSYREAKGILEALLLSINSKEKINLKAISDSKLYYYEFDVVSLEKSIHLKRFIAPKKFPSQIEDITVSFSEKPKVGEIIEKILKLDGQIEKVEFIDLYKNSYTFRISYRNENKTLTNKEVEKIREKILKRFYS
ncbi:phenylalanine--tRNA ligase subunit beta [Candidatus Woesebacteria bacterium]|nr:phenylalanine--tRNA ligase subunit beta [Candidatus Woesebacteria bacterium]QQG47251.1 MAG: phenylalanine--tRNA ligase subunit beta [Candidatus Woesebacteria bacterium]